MGYLYLLLDLLQVRGPAVLGDRVHVVQLPHGRQGHRARARLPRALPLVAGRPHVPRLLAGDRPAGARSMRLPRARARLVELRAGSDAREAGARRAPRDGAPQRPVDGRGDDADGHV